MRFLIVWAVMLTAVVMCTSGATSYLDQKIAAQFDELSSVIQAAANRR